MYGLQFKFDAFVHAVVDKIDLLLNDPPQFGSRDASGLGWGKGSLLQLEMRLLAQPL